MEKKRVWIDTDLAIGMPATDGELASVDDGWALIQMLLAPQIEVRGISTVFGNTDVDTAAQLAKTMVEEFATRPVPVYRGAAGVSADGLAPCGEAVDALAAELRKQPLHILAIGPGTNLFCLIKQYPELIARIKQLVMVAGRRTTEDHFLVGPQHHLPFPDWNFDLHPEAFREIIRHEIPLVLHPFEIAHQVWIRPADLDCMETKGEAAQYLAAASRPWLNQWKTFGVEGFNPFGVMASQWLLFPDRYHSKQLQPQIVDYPDDTQPDYGKTKPYLILRPPSTNGYTVTYCYAPGPGFKRRLFKSLLPAKRDPYTNNGGFLLDPGQLDRLEKYLKVRCFLVPDEKVLSATVPGSGNRNCTLRVDTGLRTFIVKQSRSYVEKYTQILVPAERAISEGRFYQLIQPNETLYKYTAKLKGFDEQAKILVLEDLGESSEMTKLYKKGETLSLDHLKQLMEYVSVLHDEFNSRHVEPSITNAGMRVLNAEHVFRIPFMEENGFDLDTVLPGLQQIAMKYKQDEALKSRLNMLEQVYLTDGDYLQHGDYCPGSWLEVGGNIKVIDSEFSFFGPAEFDLSVMHAHLLMAQQPNVLIEQVWKLYRRPAAFFHKLADQLTGVEIMRRLIGLAQLPLDLSLEEREALLEKAYGMIMG